MAASFPISFQLGETAVASTSAPNSNSSDTATELPNFTRISSFEIFILEGCNRVAKWNSTFNKAKPMSIAAMISADRLINRVISLAKRSMVLSFMEPAPEPDLCYRRRNF
jgi:hypothetical protein